MTDTNPDIQTVPGPTFVFGNDPIEETGMSVSKQEPEEVATGTLSFAAVKHLLTGKPLRGRRPTLKGRLRRVIPVAVVADEGGSFSVIVLNLPGVGSCGDTEQEAIANVREALVGAIEEYESSGAGIPWKQARPEDVPSGATIHKLILDA